MEPNVNTQKVGGEKPSLLGMITSPGLQFERMKTKSPVWGAFFLFIVIAAIASAVTAYQAMNNPELIGNAPDEAAAGMMRNIALGAGAITGLLGAAVWFFIAAGFYKIIMMLMGNDTPYMKLLSIYLYASIVTYLGVVVNLILRVVLGGDATTSYTSLGTLFEPGTFAYGIGSAFEIFSIWGLVVTGLGLHIAAGLSKKQATILVVVFFILSVAFSSLTGLTPKA
ncbi:Yip1 family protein [Bacillus sp. DX1.1]|uniref:Yip1 family protein n=1 Tax=unclassified Bacillus (in: firmicutes) TaxID=185979 RepID=UPI0025708E68|nr:MULTISPECIES: Yip1 family protein [unclassified Bacillus (in: firmicutes)]MDM5157319.1 Yip1 family protein [Bacillus sp. DX1.1]WJE81546.1 Yip1 family protein [Bacillus sp. DX3.1]